MNSMAAVAITIWLIVFPIITAWIVIQTEDAT